jgi:hypothetical protein
MAEEIYQTSNELDDASRDRAINTERDQTTTDLSQDVDTQERIRSQAVSFEGEATRRDRAQYDAQMANQLAFTQQMQAVMLQGLQNMVNSAEMSKNQDRRHVDHTLTDLHGSDVNPGAAPNV